MAARPHLQQQGYDPALPRLQKAYKFLQQEGHEIGFHPGYATLGNLKVLKEEKERLEKACDVKVVSGRQHFLKFQVPHTWRDWEQAGMEYDSTMGYADCEGFRCGTCHPFKPFDMETDREINIFEIPLIIMDVTLANYRNMTVEETRALIIDFARRCAEVEGVFTLLWHNTMLLHENLAWKKMYFDVLKQLTEFFKIDVSTYMEGS